MDFQYLNDRFTIPGVLAFAQTEHGLVRANVTTKICSAEIYLQGAHLTQWQPSGQEPVLFLSERAAFVPGKAIRGGVPLVFPWFGARTTVPGDPKSPQLAGPSHGFARTSEWTLAFAALAGDDLHLTFTLGPSDLSRSFGYDRFQLAYQLMLGSELRMELAVVNQSDAPMRFEEALHTYFAVGDAEQIAIIGLSDTEYLDKTDGYRRKHESETLLRFTGEIDRAYLNTEATVNLDDPVMKRRITVGKANSATTVIWNPWTELSAKLDDMAPEGWRRMTCIETANAAADIVTLAPGEQHVMEAHVFVQEFAAGWNEAGLTKPGPPEGEASDAGSSGAESSGTESSGTGSSAA